MDYQDKTREELIAELQQLQRENRQLKLALERDTGGRLMHEIDLSRLNKAMEELNETNSYLENLINYANAPIIVWDPQFRITRFNHAFEKLTGRKEAEVIGKSIELLFPPALVENSMELIRKTQTGERLETVEIEILHCDQTIHIVLWNSATLFSSDGKTPLATIAQGQEITKRVNAEKALRQSEERFHSLFDNLIDGSALHSLIYNDQGVPVDYRIVEVNPAFEVHLGLSREKVINKTSKEAYGGDEPPYFETYSRVALTGKPESFEAYFAPLDMHFSITVYCPAKHSFATIFENITERKKAEQAHDMLLTKYQVLFDILPIGITISNSTGKIIESNRIAEDILGLSIKEQEKRNIDGHEWRIIRPDGSSMPATEFASVRALKEGRQVSNMEMGIVKDNNQITWLNVSATPIPVEGYGVAIVYNDLTERKQAESEKERTQNLLEDSQRIGKIGAWEFNIDTHELTWTREMYNIHEVDLTFKPRVDLRTSFYTPESVPVIDNAIQHVIEHGGSYEVDSEIITAKGNFRSVKSVGKADLENRRIIGLFQDITESKKTEQKLRELNATKDKFFSIIAHDLRSPFNGILGFSEILNEEARESAIDSIVEYSGIINSLARQTYSLLENLLDWAKTQQHGLHVDVKQISISKLINNEIEGLKFSADKKNISLINKTDKEISITADEKMLASVLRNLISNAIKFTPRNGSVHVEATRITDQVEVSVSDTGVGMEEEKIGKLFKIETSSHSPGTENEKGSGLGLLLCKEFVEKQGGKIWVESEKGKGSRFTFSIPVIGTPKP